MLTSTVPNKTEAEAVAKYSAIGTESDKANIVPTRDNANCNPMARANSLPLNHFTIILVTVIPATSAPTPNMAYPMAA